MKKLSSIAHKDGFSILYNASLEDSMKVMLKNKNGSVVLLKDKYPIGILTEGTVLDLIKDGVDFKNEILEYAKTTIITANHNRPIESAFDIVVTNNIRRLVLIDDNGKYSGMVLQEDLFDFLEEDVYKVDLKVIDLLRHNHNVVSVEKNIVLWKILDIMRVKKIGSIIVTDSIGNPIGIITEKDILNAGWHKSNLNQEVEKLMSSPIHSVNTQDPITDVITLMRSTNRRRVLVLNQDNEMCGILTNRDIFKHIKGNVARMLEIKLRHAKEIMNLLPEAIIEIFDAPNHQVIHWINKKAKEHFGDNLLEYPPEKLLGKTWGKLYNQLQGNGHIENFLTVVNGRSFEFSGTLSQNINSRYIKLIARDITEHETMKQLLQNEAKIESKLRQEQEYLMMQQSRLASMGEMIGHIAHQWRQPLAQLGGIFMNLESAQAFGELDDKYLQNKIANGNDMIKYMSQTIDDFRLFFTPHEEENSFDIVFAIKQAIKIISGALDYHHIDVGINAEDGEFFLENNRVNEFTQVILNILNNAKDILSESNSSKKYIDISLSQTTENIIIIICDNGGGIRKDILPNIFKPYITTKEHLNGTGIGLYISQLIVEQKMNGIIKASNKDSGACFKLQIPINKK